MIVDLYSWDVSSGDGMCAGPGGVSSDRSRALDALAEALRNEPPGAHGSMWMVHLRMGRHPEYTYDGLLATGLHDPRSGAVTVDDPT